jgi:hypothetical protein
MSQHVVIILEVDLIILKNIAHKAFVIVKAHVFFIYKGKLSKLF